MSYSTKFLEAVERTLKWEGGETVDTGGHTRYGISKRAHPSVDISTLTREGAIKIYFSAYWHPHCPKIDSDEVAYRFFDLTVNMGHGGATQRIQEAVNAMYGRDKLVVDGKFGPNTQKAVNMEGNALLPALQLAAARYYNRLAKQRKYRVYLHGWLNRLFDEHK